MSELTIAYSVATVVVLLAFLFGRTSGSRAGAEKVRELEEANVRQRANLERIKENYSDLQYRSNYAAEATRQLERSLVELPEVAGRLSAARSLQEIPDAALDVVTEIFAPTFSVFYRASRGELVAVASRGHGAVALGHRVKPGEGVVGWTAVKQMPFTPEDAENESAIVRARNLASDGPCPEFSLCLPIVNGTRTFGVVLIGPKERELPHERELGRTIALITGVAITHTLVLREQQMMAKTDGLTRLMNRTHILGQLDELTKPNSRDPVAIFLFDIDHFKHYNDTNGHLAGDELLKAFAALLSEQLRDAELVGRYGGEEFLLIMPGAAKQEAYQAAERVRQLIADYPFEHRETQPLGRVSVSGGVASWPADGDTATRVLERADVALYQAKEAGRNQVASYAPPLLQDEPAARGPRNRSRS